nr:hypothetical protein [Streptomyces sp. RTd22]
MPATKTRRCPKTSDNRPPSSNPANARVYALTTHDSAAAENPSPARMSGSATDTMVASMITTKVPAHASARTRHSCLVMTRSITHAASCPLTPVERKAHGQRPREGRTAQQASAPIVEGVPLVRTSRQ